jgi:hypothetical protein
MWWILQGPGPGFASECGYRHQQLSCYIIIRTSWQIPRATVPEIAKSFGFSSFYVSYVVHGFNEIGFEVLESKYKNFGSSPKFNNDNVSPVLISP